MQRKNIALALLSLAPPPPVAAGAGIPGLDELVNAFTAALGLIIFFALTGAVILLVYVIIEALQHPRRGVAALVGLVAALIFWAAMFFMVDWIEKYVPQLAIVAWMIKNSLNSAARLIGAPPPFPNA